MTIPNEKNWRICGECISSNCQLMQHLCKIRKTQKKFLDKCKGKSVTLGEMPAALKSIEEQITVIKNKYPKLNQNAASIEPIENNYSQDANEFMNANPDLLDHSRQTKQTVVTLTVGVSMR